MVTLSLEAMATRFELVVYGDGPERARAGAEEALEEVARVERQLSRYRTDSDVARLNRHAAERPVPVEPRLFRLLERCVELSVATDGAFDVTVGPLVRVWRTAAAAGARPDASTLASARACVGTALVELDPEAYAVRYRVPGVELDFGAYGKGYAVERAIDVLRENGVTSALMHGGTSSVYGLGTPPGDLGWRVALAAPLGDSPEPVKAPRATGNRFSSPILLRDQGLSVSAADGSSFEEDGVVYGHVLDPRLAEPVCHALATAVVGPSPATCEALSTALMVNGAEWLEVMRNCFSEYQGIVS